MGKVIKVSLKGVVMLSNEERAFLDKNKDLVLILSELKERGVDVWGFISLTKELVDLLDYSKEQNIDLVAMFNFIVEQQAAQSAEVQRSHVAE